MKKTSEDIEYLRANLGNRDGKIILNLSDKELENWYEFLLGEKIQIYAKSVSGARALDAVRHKELGHSNRYIARRLSCSIAAVDNFFINLKYNRLLDRVDKCAVHIGDREEPKWEWGNKLCP